MDENLEKIRGFLKDQVFNDDQLYDFDQRTPEEQWNWWLKNRKFYSKEPGFRAVGLLEQKKDWKTELSRWPEYMLTDDVLQELADEEDLDFKTLKGYVEQNAKEKAEIEGRLRRAKEIEDAGFFSPWTLASEYSKKRYIDDPNTTMFGKEGTYFKFEPSKLSSDNWANAFSGGALSSEGQSDFSDVSLGVAGATADALPGIGGVVVGPAIRGTRDILHYGSDYSKSKGEILKDFGNDLMFNVGTDYLPTAILNKGDKLAKAIPGSLGPKFGRALTDAAGYNTALGMRNTIEDSFKQLGIWGLSDDAMMKILTNDKELRRAIPHLPESPFKAEITAAFDEMGSSGAMNVVNKYKTNILDKAFAPRSIYDNAGSLKTDVLKDIQGEGTKGIRDILLNESTFRDIGKGARTAALLGRGWSKGGGAAVKEVHDAATTGTKPEESLDHKKARWAKGFATPAEMKTKEYEDFKLELLGE